MSKRPAFFEEDVELYHNTAAEFLGAHGRLLYMPHARQDYFPNARVKLEDGSIIWYGDLDMARDWTKLQALASKLNLPITIAYEDGSQVTDFLPHNDSAAA